MTTDPASEPIELVIEYAAPLGPGHTVIFNGRRFTVVSGTPSNDGMTDTYELRSIAPVTADDLRDRLTDIIQCALPADYHDGEHAVDCEACMPVVEEILAVITPELERLRAELAEARKTVTRAEGSESYMEKHLRQQDDRVNGLRQEITKQRQRSEQAKAERDALKAAIFAAMVERQRHIKEFHSIRLFDPDCAGCRIGIALSREVPARPDTQEELDLTVRVVRAEAAIERVRELARTAKSGGSVPPADCTNTCFHDICDCSGNWRPTSWKLNPADVIVALDIPETTGGVND